MWGQKGTPITLKHADFLEGGVFEGEKVNKLKGNVHLQQGDKVMTCDSAYKYIGRSYMKAFGSVHVIQQDTLHIYCDSLTYDGDQEMSFARRNVRLVDPSMTLTTDHLDYDMSSKTGTYFGGGKIVDDNGTLTSKTGTYHTSTKYFIFIDSVKMVNETYTLETDTLEYDEARKISYFNGPTKIWDEEHILLAQKGEHHSRTERSYFKDSASIETDDYILLGDSMYYDNVNDNGYAYANVSMYGKADSITIYGEEAIRVGKDYQTTITGAPLLEQVSGLDTLLLVSDTMISKEDSAKKIKEIIAYSSVEIVKDEMQGICDSLLYQTTDSTMHMYLDPVIWNEENQITADTIVGVFEDNKINRLLTFKNSFIISHDTLEQYNQIQGINTISYFLDGEIDKVHVIRNGMSLYFAHKEEDNSILGMNKVVCSDMIAKFFNGEMKGITFLTKPDANFIPPHELSMSNAFLDDYNWRPVERPNKNQLRQRRASFPLEKINIYIFP